jgi:hypothetical protein
MNVNRLIAAAAKINPAELNVSKIIAPRVTGDATPCADCADQLTNQVAIEKHRRRSCKTMQITTSK